MTLLLVTEANCKRSLDLSVGVELYQGLLKHTEDQISGMPGLKSLLNLGQQKPDQMELLQGSLCGLCSTLTKPDGLCQSDVTTPVSTVTTPRTTPTASATSTKPDWHKYLNYCISDAHGVKKDLKETPNSAGHVSLDACKSECKKSPTCSGIEWYESGKRHRRGWKPFRCNLILTDKPEQQPPATKGAPWTWGLYKDAECYVNLKYGQTQN